MKPARGPQTTFFSNYCGGIPGLAIYEMPAILIFRGMAAGLRYFRLRYLGRQPAILIFRLWAAGLRHLGLGTWRPAMLISKL